MQQAFTPKRHGLFSKLIFAFFLAIMSMAAQAQTEIVTAKNYLAQNSSQHKLTASDIDQMVVSSSYLSPTTGWYHVYFNQTHQSVEVYNGLLNLTLKGGKVEYVTNSFIADIAAKTNIKLENLTLTPIQALQQAALNVNLTASSLEQIKEVKKTQLPNGLVEKVTYTDNNLSNENIEVKLYWLQYEVQEGEKTVQKIALTWNVRFMTKDNQNSWNIHVDALSGGVVEKRDDVIRCSFGAPHQHNAAGVCAMGMLPQAREAAAATLANNEYHVFDYPVESPNHGSRSVVPAPYTRFLPMGTGPGATNGWHNDGTTDYITTRGNNVWAKEDIAADNEGTIGASPVSATLDFNYPYIAGNNVASRDAAITNLFYWNNLIHDVLYKYGFDEPSGNYQESNPSGQGLGSDFVFADAQDGAGINNANFSPGVDGANGRMQMFLWNYPNNADGDFDNGIIAHEYGHGWSTRLTGGPANSSCLGNAEQGGEGWSDYLALMLTTPWSTLTPTVANASIRRGVGTYAFDQPTTGNGVRAKPYSYDLAINDFKYSDIATFAIPHGVGSIWAAMIWDMTWEIIMQDNFIDPNIYNTPANILDMKGNVAALKLVNEGLRLQACSPSFVQARDAILQADQLLFGGRYRCAIGKAFARRGLGLYASTGASSNDRIVIEDFTPLSGPGLSSPLSASLCNNQPFNYTATVGVSGTYTYNWTRAVVSGISNAAGSGTSAAVNETLVNTTTGPVTVKYIFTVSPDLCGGTPSPQTVTVVVNPSVTPTVGTYAICQNANVPQGEGLVAPPVVGNKVSGTLTNASPTYNRGNGSNTTTYTASGTNVYYQTFTFVSPINGNVTFETINPNLINSTFGPTDTYLTLYQTSFNAGTPATNFLRGDDDNGADFASLLTHPLVQGATYVLVVTTFNNGATGTFSLQASEPGFTGTNNWYKNASGGASLATGDIFNPVGVAGSDIPNTATPGTTTFYVATDAFPDCRTPVTFTINPNHTISLTSDALTETQSVCVNTPITPITYNLGGGATGATVTGLPMWATSSVSSGVLTISGTPTVTVGSPFGYNITTTGNSCTVATESGTITVTPQLVGPTLNVKTPNVAVICTGTGVSATFNVGSGGLGCSDDYTVSIDGGMPIAYTPGSTIGANATSSIVIQGRRANCSPQATCTGTNYVTLASWNVSPQPVSPTLNAKTPNIPTICAGTAVIATFNLGSGGVGCADDYVVSIDNGSSIPYSQGTLVGSNATTSIVIQGRRANCSAGSGCTGTDYVTLASWNVVAQPVGPTLLAKTPNLSAVCVGTGVSATFNSGSGGVGCSDDYVLIIDAGTPVAYTPGSTVGSNATTSIEIRGRRANCSAQTGCNGTAYVTLASWSVNPQPVGPTLLAKTPNVSAICFGTGVSATFNAGSGGVGCLDNFTLSIDGGTPLAYTPGSTVGANANSSIVIQGRRAGCSAGAGCNGTTYVTLASWSVSPQPVGPTLLAKTPNVSAICFGTGVSATFNAGSGGVGCSDDYTVSIDGGSAVAYTPGSTVGTTAVSSIVIQGRRANCDASSGCNGTSYVTLASWSVNPLPTASISGSTALCQNAPFPNVTFTGNGGTKPYVFTYQINTGGNLTVSTTGVSNSVSVAQTTAVAGVFNYSLVSVKDANGCEQLQGQTATITVHAPPVVSTPKAHFAQD
jgi:hypothetical protein